MTEQWFLDDRTVVRLIEKEKNWNRHQSCIIITNSFCMTGLRQALTGPGRTKYSQIDKHSSRLKGLLKPPALAIERPRPANYSVPRRLPHNRVRHLHQNKLKQICLLDTDGNTAAQHMTNTSFALSKKKTHAGVNSSKRATAKFHLRQVIHNSAWICRGFGKKNYFGRTERPTAAWTSTSTTVLCQLGAAIRRVMMHWRTTRLHQ